MKVIALSDTGAVRNVNQDSFMIVNNKEKDFLAFAVADGLGGHNAGEVASKICTEILKEYFKIVNKDQQKKMVFAVFLFHRRRKQIIFRIIINHGLRKYLIFVMTFGASKLRFHKCGHLVHIQVNCGYVFRFDIINAVETF